MDRQTNISRSKILNSMGGKYIMSVQAEQIQVTLGDYRSLRISDKSIVITESQIQSELEYAQESAADYAPKYTPAEIGDQLTIDFIGYMDGAAFPGGSGNDFPLVLGSGTFIPGFEEQLVGSSMGDHVKVSLAFPEGYQASDLAGKDSIFEVDVKAVKTPKLPEINDAFAASVSDCRTLAELKEQIRESLWEEKRDSLKNHMIEELMKICEVTVPKKEIDTVADNLKQNFFIQLQNAGQTLDSYLKQVNMTKEKFDSSADAQAEMMIRSQSILAEIAEKENITVSDEELNLQLDELARSYSVAVDEFVESIGERGVNLVRRDYEAEKALNFMISGDK